MFNSFLGMGASTAVDESAVLDEMRHTPLVECVDDPLDACIRITYESTVNFNNITKALAMDELKYFQENGVEMVYEAGKVVEFFKAAKDWIMKVWSNIIGIFKKAIDAVDKLPAFAWCKTNEKKIKALPELVRVSDMVSKLPEGKKAPDKLMAYSYSVGKTETAIVEKLLTSKFNAMIKQVGLGINIEDYSRLNVIQAKLKEYDNAEAARKAAEITSSEFKNNYYREILNVKDVSGYEDFSKKCIYLFRSAEKKEVDVINVKDCYYIIKDATSLKRDIKNAYASQETIYKGWIKMIENARKEAEKANKDNKSDDFSAALAIMRYGVSAIKDASSVANSILRAHLSAVRSNASTAMAKLSYAIRLNDAVNGKKKNDNKEEVQHNSAVTTESFLASLKMI